MLYELGRSPLSQMRHDARLILVFKIINGLAEVSFAGILIEVYKDTMTKQNKKLRHIGHLPSSIISHITPKLLVWKGFTFAKAPSLAYF